MTAAATDSVCSQTYSNIEIIIVDDGSTEPDSVGLSQHTDPRVTLIRHPVNQGAAAARNAGISQARGEFVAFLDSDDSWPSDKIEQQLKYMNSGAGRAIDLCCTGFYYSRIGRGRGKRVRLEINGTTSTNLLDGCFLSPGSTLMARRAFLHSLGPQNESLGRLEDWEWLLRASRITNIALLPKILAYVESNERANFKSVALAGQTLRRLQGRAVFQQHGARGFLRFSASVDLECSVCALKCGRTQWLIFYIFRALISHPMRVLHFFGGAVRRQLC